MITTAGARQRRSGWPFQAFHGQGFDYALYAHTRNNSPGWQTVQLNIKSKSAVDLELQNLTVKVKWQQGERTHTEPCNQGESKMEIKVLGPGCAKCQKLYDATKELLEREGIEAELIKVEKLDEIMNYGVMMTPGLVIDGELKAAGKIPREKKLVAWLREAAKG